MLPMISSYVDIVIWVIILLFSASFHELAHGWVAYRCGDNTAKEQGRLTLNPLAHICPFNSVLLPTILYLVSGGRFIFGGAKPVPIDPSRLNNPERDMALSAAAGPISNMLIIIGAIFVLIALKPIIAIQDFEEAIAVSIVVRVLLNIILLNAVLGLFNLFPIPPLDGSRIIRYFMPFLREAFDSLDQFGLVLLILLLQVPPILNFLGWMIFSCLGIAGFLYNLISI